MNIGLRYKNFMQGLGLGGFRFYTMFAQVKPIHIFFLSPGIGYNFYQGNIQIFAKHLKHSESLSYYILEPALNTFTIHYQQNFSQNMLKHSESLSYYNLKPALNTFTIHQNEERKKLHINYITYRMTELIGLSIGLAVVNVPVSLFIVK